MEDGITQVVRPVIRLDSQLRQVREGGDVILTRIEPHRRESSMIFRIRCVPMGLPGVVELGVGGWAS